jgi:hypothetical protein
MKKYIIIVLLCVTNAVFAQQKKLRKDSLPYITIPAGNIAGYIDSVRTVIINDTTRFNRDQLFKREGVIRNKTSYSKLYVIDNKYSYLLDVIPGAQVMEFLNEFFVPAAIETIVDYTEPVGASLLYGERADKGAVYIKMKKGVKYNPKVGGIAPDAKP